MKCFPTSLLLAAWLAGLPISRAATGAYPKLEAAFNITTPIADPFDYVAADVRVQMVTPECATNSLPAFFDGGTTWRVRHTPRSAGRYFLAGVTLNGLPLAVSNLQPTNWFVTGAPTSPGFVRVDSSNPRRFLTDNGRRYFPVGENVAWNSNVSNDYPRMFARMAAAGENWARVWMDHFGWTSNGKNLDWPKVDNALGKLSLPVAQRWDLIVDEAERAGIAFQMVFQHHGQYSSTNGSNVNPNWEGNPYNTLNGGFLTSATQFFTNATAKAFTKRKLRYAVARWGYSPSIMAWELWNEVQFTDAAYAGQWSAIAAWHAEMAAFLRAQDAYGHLITTSSELTKPIWGATDFYQYHNYASDMVTASRDAEEPPAGSPVRPNFAGEGANLGVPRLWVHAPLWASLMSAQAGALQPWWWDTIDPENDYFLFKSLNDFLALSGLANQDGLAKSAPALTASQNGPLSFAPGGGWRVVTQDTFTVGNSAPEGISTASSFLHGAWHHADMNMRRGYTFFVNYSQPGTFAVQVLETSTYGNANLRIVLDGLTKTNVTFFSTIGGPTNATFTVAVPAGAHTIALTNGALDWLVLGNLTLNPYVPLLGAYAVGNAKFAAAWVWHRTNLYATNASVPVSGTVEITNLAAGTYSAAWWDTYEGRALSNFSLTVPVDGATNRLDTPAVLRSSALYVGRPAQAVLSAPSLDVTLGTNSPPFTATLVLSNAGGLPLNYQLALLAPRSADYYAVSSTQPGGPAFAWRDISATGRDITTNFTPLAPPKTAGDEGIAGPFYLGFAFPFFDSSVPYPGKTQVWVSPNGFLTFSPFAGDTSLNWPMVGSLAPSNLVALVWDDLDLSAGGKVFVASEPELGRFTVQYEAVRFKGTSSNVTAQVTLLSTGDILMQYRALGRTNSCTVGVQNDRRDEGLTVTYNSSAYLRSGLAVRVGVEKWRRAAPAAGFVPGGKSQPIEVTFDPSGIMPVGVISTLLLRTSDPANPQFVLPVWLTISDRVPAAPAQLTATALTWAQVALQWADRAGNESAFEIQRRTGEEAPFATIGTTAANATTFTDLTAPSRSACWYRVRTTNSFGASPWSDSACAITPAAPMDYWRMAKFGTMDNAGLAADDADSEGDGLRNFIEYALGLEPLVANANPFTSSFTNGHLTVTFRRPHPAPADVRYLGEVTTDLASGLWQSGPDTATLTALDNGDGTEQVTVSAVATPPTPNTLYLRVRFARQ